MIGVTWLYRQPRLASARFRANIPREVLIRRGVVKDGEDLVVASKHNWSVADVRAHFPQMVMDVCDDHFHNHRRGHYIEACNVADQVTCNSEVMRDIIKRETGRDATVIDDPYEDDELSPNATGSGVLWFGHSLNLPDLRSVIEDIRHPLSVVDSSNYTPEYLDTCLRRCKVVLLPTGRSDAKSANRAVKAIRYGKYPVCGPLPAYRDLGLCETELGLALDHAMSADNRDKVRALQRLVRYRFSPETVADAWQKVLCA